MDAIEARAISDRAAAMNRVRHLIETIRKAAEKGDYEAGFVSMADQSVETLKSLGYAVSSGPAGVFVNWAAKK